jgi:hypothetical protein
VLRICGGDIELVGLLADLGERELNAMVPERQPAALRRPPGAKVRGQLAALRAPAS